jgi:hypothetical protein
MPHRGIAPFHADAENYKVFRNVKDFGAQGDGVADDTEAIKFGDAFHKCCRALICTLVVLLALRSRPVDDVGADNAGHLRAHDDPRG